MPQPWARLAHTAAWFFALGVAVAGCRLEPAGPGVASAPVFSDSGSLAQARWNHTATLLRSGLVLLCGGRDAAGPLATCELYEPGGGTFSAGGSLQQARSGHSATLLGNGEVLIAGGRSVAVPLSAVELYDPTLNAFRPGQSLTAAREGHTATSLTDGRVLVAGGAATLAAEVYDPAGDSWTPTLDMGALRSQHAAVRLPDGSVLLSAGLVGGTPAGTAERYVPATNAWSASGTLNIARARHTGTLLRNGLVLVAGGFVGGGPTASAELFDPSSPGWSPTGSMTSLRDGHTSTVLPSGQVLVGNGAVFERYNPATATWGNPLTVAVPRTDHTSTLLPTGDVLVVGGQGPQGSAVRFNPSAPAWTAGGNLGTARARAAAVLLPDGRVLLAGGFGAGTTAELFDPGPKTWSPTAGAMTASRADHTATLLFTGQVLIAGGLGSGNNSRETAELFNPATNTFAAANPMGNRRRNHATVTLRDGRVLVFGGFDGTTTTYPAQAEVFDPATGSWTSGGTMQLAGEYRVGVPLLDGRVLAAGGALTAHTSAELYDPASNSWTLTGSMGGNGRSAHALVLLPSGKVLAVGGIDSSSAYPAATELYDPALGTWSPAGTLNVPRTWFSVAGTSRGTVVVAGGTNAGGATASVEEFSPWSQTWEALSPLATARAQLTLTSLLDGTLLVAGGGSVLPAQILADGVLPVTRPTLSGPLAEVAPGTTLNLSGSALAPSTEGSSGNTRASPTLHPLVQLSRWEGHHTALARVTSFGQSAVAAVLSSSLAPGWYRVSVVVHGVASNSQPLLVRGPAVATRLAFTTQPASTSAGSALAPSVQVTIQDAGGSTVTTSTDEVTLALGNNPAGGVLSGTLTVAAVAGVATFPGLSITRAGNGYTLAATSGSHTPAQSDAFNVSPGAAAQYAVSGLPSSARVGELLAVQVEVTDGWGNRVVGYGGTAEFLSSDGVATLPPSYTFSGADQGLHGFSNAVAFATPGTHSVTVRDRDVPSITGGQSGISVVQVSGGSCTSNPQCETGVCASGTCCDRACGGPCEACDLAGTEGACTAVTDDTPCPDSVFCDGVESCQAGTCSDGTPQACVDPFGLIPLVCSESLRACVADPSVPPRRLQVACGCRSSGPSELLPLLLALALLRDLSPQAFRKRWLNRRRAA